MTILQTLVNQYLPPQMQAKVATELQGRSMEATAAAADHSALAEMAQTEVSAPAPAAAGAMEEQTPQGAPAVPMR